MFCDEPTSGLSATDAELCVRCSASVEIKSQEFQKLGSVFVFPTKPKSAASS